MLRSRMQKPKPPTWKELLNREQPLLLPCAHDALSARLIERAGFSAYSIGGFALVGSRYGIPDIGLAAFGEISAGIRDIMAATSLPVMVDGDTGYGDVKNVAHTIEGYEAMGASSIFLEDQVAPKRCGHMAGKDVIPAADMVAKIKAAVGARRSKDFFIIARTDARAVHGLDEALRRGEQYLKAGADGIFIEAPQTVKELEMIGAAFKGVPQLANMLERRPDAGAAAERIEGDGICDGGLSDHADFSRGAHHRARAERHQGGQARQQRRRELRRVQGHHQLRRMGAHRGRLRAGPGGIMKRIGAFALLVGLSDSWPPAHTRKPRCGSRSAASPRCSICR